MGDETKLQKLRRGQAAFARGDNQAASDVIAEDVDWGTTGTFPGTEVFYRGIEDLGEWMEDLLSAWDKLTIDVAEVLHDGDDVLVVVEHLTARGLGSGAEVEMKVHAVYWFAEGKVFKRRAFTEAEPALAAADAA